MSEIINRTILCPEGCSEKEAVGIFRDKGEGYKIELLEDIPDEEVSLYEEGYRPLQDRILDSTDRYLLSTSECCRRLLAREREEQDAQSLRTSFTKKEDLKQHLDFLEEVKRDHRKLGKNSTCSA
jgi:threonyl-tRNA synthetase